MAKYITIETFIKRTGRCDRQVRRMLNSKRIPGAARIKVNGRWTWVIPLDAEWPDDKRYKRPP